MELFSRHSSESWNLISPFSFLRAFAPSREKKAALFHAKARRREEGSKARFCRASLTAFARTTELG